MEQWKPVKNYEHLFEVSNKGNFRRKGSDKELSQCLTKTGYFLVSTKPEGRKGKCKTFRVHCEVAKAFLENPDGKPQVNHKDGNKINNFVENLEWCTAKENTGHAWKTGLAKAYKGDKNKNTKTPDYVVLEILEKVSKENKSLRSVCKEYGVYHTLVSRRKKNLGA